MGGCEGFGIMKITPEIIVYAMRHGQKEFGSDDPSLTKRGCIQAAEVACKHLIGIDFDAIYHGRHARHLKTALIARVVAEIPCDIFQTSLLSPTDAMHKAGDQCAIAGLKHPEGLPVGFRVDTWFKTDPALMNDCKQHLGTFFRDIPRVKKIILAISSCPIIESAVLQPEKTRLLGDCGIIKYVADGAGVIISSETIFEGFFEKPPQKNIDD